MTTFNSQSILIADDDREFRKSLVKIFQKAGYKANGVSDGKQASELLCKECYPLIVLDLKLPGKSGLELLGEIKKKAPESKVIIVTAYGEMESYRKAMNAGAFEYLDKPVKRKDILEQARRALSDRHN